MADILIRGMEMPDKKPIFVVIDAAGQARLYNLLSDCYCDNELYEAVELPPHGDLIDRDALFKQMGVTDMDCYKCEFGNHGFCGRGEFSAACEAIEDAPVVIPASKEDAE